MARTAGSRFEDILPLLKAEEVGAMNWGFVSGKTQTIFPWGSKEGSPEPAVWFHDILRPDGSPYMAAEVELIRNLAGKSRPAGAGRTAAVAEPFHAWALTPPLGWNSWDSFGQAVTEADVKANADFMAARLAKLGWRYIVVDIEWSEPQRLGPGLPRSLEVRDRRVRALRPGRIAVPLIGGRARLQAAGRLRPRQGPEVRRPHRPWHPAAGRREEHAHRGHALSCGRHRRQDRFLRLERGPVGRRRQEAGRPGVVRFDLPPARRRGASISSRPTTSATGARRSPCCGGPSIGRDGPSCSACLTGRCPSNRPGRS